jgi:uncharacterized protein
MRCALPNSLQTVRWASTWNPGRVDEGLEHLLLADDAAESVILAVDQDQGPFRLDYSLSWDAQWQIEAVDLQIVIDGSRRSLHLRTSGNGEWQDGAGHRLPALKGCRDIDIWPTPFTNSFPIRRQPLAVGERREFLMAWINALDLTALAQPQAYTRIADRVYLFENLDGTGFRAELPVDERGIVLNYPDLFRRLG